MGLRLAARPPEREPEKSNAGPFSFLKKPKERTKALPPVPEPPAKKNPFFFSFTNKKTPDAALADKDFSPEELESSSASSAPKLPAPENGRNRALLLLVACAVAAVPGVLPSGAGSYGASVAVLAGVVAFHEAGHLVAALSQVATHQATLLAKRVCFYF